MKIEDTYKARYEVQNTPWDVGRPDFNLVEVVKEFSVQKGQIKVEMAKPKSSIENEKVKREGDEEKTRNGSR